MKKIDKSNEPSELRSFREGQPRADWEQFRDEDDARAYRAVRTRLLIDQRNLCAYCEVSIAAPGTHMVEHFHPKRDKTNSNWDLDWHNLLATCHGGTNENNDPNLFRHPRLANRSCDKAKEDHLPHTAVEGFLLNPLTIPRSPSLFSMRDDGMLRPNPDACAQWTADSNNYPNTEELVAETIRILHLNCPRLKDARARVFAQVREAVTRIRKRHKNTPQQARTELQDLARQTLLVTPAAFYTARLQLLGRHLPKDP